MASKSTKIIYLLVSIFASSSCTNLFDFIKIRFIILRENCEAATPARWKK